MKKLLQAAALTALVAVGFGGSTVASAAVVSCPGTIATTDREFTVDTTPGAICQSYGVGNINGNILQDPILQNNPSFVFLDKTGSSGGLFDGALTITGGGGLAGTFTISGIIGYSIYIAFKSGEGRFDPDWALFKLAAGVTTGSWTISSQGLSHANLYGVKNDQVPGVPLPAGIVLLLTGLVGLGGLARMRKQA